MTKTLNKPLRFVVDEHNRLIPANKQVWEEVSRRYAVNDLVTLVEFEKAERGKFFTDLAKIYATLPEHLAERFVGEDDFRYYGLIKTGHCDHVMHSTGSKKQAKELANILGREEGTLIVIDHDDPRLVHKYTAHSMAEKSMQPATFYKAADDVIAWAKELVGATGEDVPETNG